MSNYLVFNTNASRLKTQVYGTVSDSAFPVSSDSAGSVNTRTPNSQFDDLVNTERQVIVELKSVYGLSELRDVVTETGDGSVTNNGTEYVLATGAAAASVANLDSAEKGRYVPGYAGQTGI